MKKLNKKGFAISTMLYGVLIIVLLLLTLIVNTMAFNRSKSKALVDDTVKNLEDNYSEPAPPAGKYNHHIDTASRKDKYEEGNLVRYEVKTGNWVEFFVIKDEDNILTLIQKDNTINTSVNWVKGEVLTNKKGPDDVVSSIMNKTKDWEFVRDLSYQMGSTDTPYTESSIGYDACDLNLDCNYSYFSMNFVQIKAKARMITVDEAKSLGCTTTAKSCNTNLYNYLDGVSEFGLENGEGYGYWTMNSYYNKDAEDQSGEAWYITMYGALSHDFVITTGTMPPKMGRAVVEVNKYE